MEPINLGKNGVKRIVQRGEKKEDLLAEAAFQAEEQKEPGEKEGASHIVAVGQKEEVTTGMLQTSPGKGARVRREQAMKAGGLLQETDVFQAGERIPAGGASLMVQEERELELLVQISPGRNVRVMI
jgi:hypothetical protein